MGGPLFELHWSKIATFERCRKQYWFRYLSGNPQPAAVVSVPYVIGKGVHRAMKTLCDTGDPDDGGHQLETFLRMPGHELAGPGTEGYAMAMSLYAAGCDAHASIASEDRWSELDTWVPAREAGINVRARIDRADRMADGSWLVIDWKTGAWDAPEDTDRQLDLGHLALRTTRPQIGLDTPARAIAWNLRTGNQRVRALTGDDARRTKQYAVRYAQRIQATTDWSASPSRACSFCEWRDQCEDAEPDLSWLDGPGDDDLFDPLEPAGDEGLLPFD